MKNIKQIITDNSIIKILIIGLFVFTFGSLSAQETVVVGQVLSRTDKTPVSSVNIHFKNTEKVIQSNEEGYFLIRNTGKESVLIFSSIGFKKLELKIKPGQSVGTQVEMEEESTLLQEALIIPGINPAVDLLKKVRLMRPVNDVSRKTGFNAKSKEQNLVLLSKIDQRTTNKHIFDQLKKGNISKTDSSLVLPMYMAETTYQVTSSNKKELSKDIFSSSETGVKIIEKLVGSLSSELNFYDNSVTVFGKNMVSPLSNVGNAYYLYYLADSTYNESGKQYEIHFRTKNVKNLAFEGKLWVDSATLALTKIEAELPIQANINFIHNLRISEKFVQLPTKYWTRQTENMALNMSYALLADSLHPQPEIFIKRTATYHTDNTASELNSSFAQSNYAQETLNDKLKDLNNTPLLRTAKWIAEIALTGYIPAGKIDIGKIQQTIRITDIEGLRLTLPFRTNEKLWKNISLGGYVGYGFKNEVIKYSGFAQFKIPGNQRRILSLNYTNDYRRIDFNYDDFIYRENPLVTGDEDISSTLLAFRSANKISDRREYSLTFSNDWNSDIESNFYLRSNKLFSANWLPLKINGVTAPSLQVNSATISTRFSNDEKTYDDFMQRIYVANYKPVFYSILEAGQYSLGTKKGHYERISGVAKQNILLDYGQLSYVAEAGCIFGNVPYPLLETPEGTESGGYGMYQFSMMNYMEYAADKYVNFQSELMLNGLVLNQIPLVKLLNLREFFSFKMAYGSLSDSNRSLIDYPGYMQPFTKPYVEVGIGLTNILHIFTIQSIWRLTDLNRSGSVPWGIRTCLSLSF